MHPNNSLSVHRLPGHEMQWKREFLLLESLFVSEIPFVTTILWLHNRIKVKMLEKAVTTLSSIWHFWLRQRNGPMCQLQRHPELGKKCPFSLMFCPGTLVLASSIPMLQPPNLSFQNLSLMENWARLWFSSVIWIKNVFLESNWVDQAH